MTAVPPPFAVISGTQVQQALQGSEKQVVELVEATYRLHGAGDSVNPPSYFLRFPDRPTSRIIALPADRPVVFSPFGLGVLYLAVGKHVYDVVTRSGDLHVIDGFFRDLNRHG